MKGNNIGFFSKNFLLKMTLNTKRVDPLEICLQYHGPPAQIFWKSPIPSPFVHILRTIRRERKIFKNIFVIFKIIKDNEELVAN